MDVVKLSKRGQMSLPAAVYPVEFYSDARVKAFETSNRLASADAARLRKALRRRKR